MIYYKLVQTTIDEPGIAKVIINAIIWYHGLPNSIVNKWDSVFILKFSLCYFLGIKQKFSTAFQTQTDGWTKKQNSKIEAYLQAFVNIE